ncbi:MAG: hypothetical protein WAX89_07655, partial [Alphaproteobacteria bacterium]
MLMSYVACLSLGATGVWALYRKENGLAAVLLACAMYAGLFAIGIADGFQTSFCGKNTFGTHVCAPKDFLHVMGILMLLSGAYLCSMATGAAKLVGLTT